MKKTVKTYCFQCYNGPDPFRMVVEDGKIRHIEPDMDCKDFSAGEGKVCVKAYGLIQKMYNPNRIKAPLIRTNPRKGHGEDPGFREATWEEALELVASKLKDVRAKGLIDEGGYPRVALTMGEAGSPAGYIGTFPAFMSAWGPIDYTLGGGQGSKCYHSEHLYGELWHRAFIVASDTPRNRLTVSFGHNTNASAGVSGVMRHADARGRGYRRIQIEPHMSVSAATADEWVAIKPKTDAPFIYGMIHHILHEMNWRAACDLDFVKKRTNSPYLIGPKGYFMRDAESGEVLIWDAADNAPKIYNDISIKDYALTGTYKVKGIERGPDGQSWQYPDGVEVRPSFDILLEHMKPYSPEWAAKICDVPASTIRRIAAEIVETAMTGQDIEIDGERMPLRPVGITMGKTVNNGPGGYQACWGRTILAMLTGSLETAGGTMGSSQRLNRPHHDRWSSVWPGNDGFYQNFLNSTSKDRTFPFRTRASYAELVPLVMNTGWSAFLAPVPHAWKWFDNPPENWPKPTLPDVWFIYRANPNISMYYTEYMKDITARFPFMVTVGYTIDETNWYADVILPDHTDLEGLQLFRVGPSVHSEAFWGRYGFALRQPGCNPPYNTIDPTDLATELASRTGILKDYHDTLNAGLILGVRLSGNGYNYNLEPDRKYTREEIWDRICRASVRLLTEGREERTLEWFKEHGYYTVPYPQCRHFLHPVMVKWGLRYEVPYQSTVKIAGEELGARLKEAGVNWWNHQVAEYEAMPLCEDYSALWDKAMNKAGKKPDEFPLFMINTRSMQYAWGSNSSLPLMAEAASYVTGFGGLVLNASTAAKLGISDGDRVIVESPVKRRACKAIVRSGVRPDTVVLTGQFGNWRVPFAKDLDIPNLNEFVEHYPELIDAGGSGADVVKVRVYRDNATEVRENG